MTLRITFPVGLLAALLALAAVAPARADTLQDISGLMKQGQHAQALEQIDKYLSTRPRDAQGRFLKGLILTEMNRPNEAIGVFQKLTEDYPELPEPYNNLAVIYAQQKQYDKAKQALEMAIRTHPSYATAHENLGDIYARLASQAYDKALQIDSSNTSAQTKLAMIRELMGTRPGSSRPVATAVPARTPAAEPPRANEVAKSAGTPKAEARAEPKAEPQPAEKERSGDVTAEVMQAIDSWAAAWSSKNVKAYLAHYARDFRTPNGESRAAWEAERSQRINKPGPISVTVDNVRITAEGGDRVTARFRQHYTSANLKTSSNKTLVLARQDGRWLIQQERVGQ